MSIITMSRRTVYLLLAAVVLGLAVSIWVDFFAFGSTVPEEEAPPAAPEQQEIDLLGALRPIEVPQPIAQIMEQARESCPEGVLPFHCAQLDFANERMVKIRGQLFVEFITGERRGDVLSNNAIWFTVNDIMDQGYNLHTVLLSGQGTRANPHTWEILLVR